MANRVLRKAAADPKDRRKSIRYKAGGGAFAILKFNAKEEVAQILDISHSGIAFRYFANGNPPDGLCELDITFQNDDLLVSNLHFQTIYDTDYFSSLNTTSGGMRRHGARFNELSDMMLQQLDYFIQNYTFGLA